MENETTPTKLEIITDLVCGNAENTSSYPQRSISARLDIPNLIRLDAFANLAVKSRNEMLNLLLDGACQTVYRDLPEPALNKVKALEAAAYKSFLGEKD